MQCSKNSQLNLPDPDPINSNCWKRTVSSTTATATFIATTIAIVTATAVAVVVAVVVYAMAAVVPTAALWSLLSVYSCRT